MTRLPLPRSPFSTPLSGSAKEAEERIRNIFQYKKKRPPILGLAAACALALLCGGLVSCQPVRQSFPTLVMDTQYYDSQGNYIEIPALAVPGDVEPDEGVTSINQALEGFRMGADGQPIFYLTARVDDRDDAVNDAVSGSDNLYIWSGGTFSRYEQYAADDLQPLVPAEETMELDPPLWCQWYFTGGEPEGGFAAPASPMPPSQTVLGRAEDYGLRSLEYSLWRDGWETPAGPGMQTSALFFDEPGTRIERPDEGLTQNEGDYWLTYEWEGLSAGYYHLAADSSETLGSIDTTRTDVATWRGVRVGDSREDVLAAYPEAKSQSDRIPSLNEENCLWIAEDLEQDRGLALLFYLDGDTVRQITLTRFLS